MSLYNMLFGVNAHAAGLLAVLGLSPTDIPRFRDAFLNGKTIVIHTRTGGGNRECYDEPNEENPSGPWNSDLRGHPCYLEDRDSEFDATYANFFFNFPEEFADDLQALSSERKDDTPSEKWRALFERLDAQPTGKKEGP